MWVLSQAHPDVPEHATDDTVRQTHAARACGCPVVWLPPRLAVPEIAASFQDVSVEPPQPAVWFGYIPQPEVYAAVYEAALSRGLRLLNDPDQHLAVFELDRAYPHLEELTAKSIVVRSPAEVEAASQRLALPWFIRGAMLSNKRKGRGACIAETLEQAREIVGELLAEPHLSRGRVLLREMIPLRTASIDGYGLPAGREFRVFLYRGEVISHGFYWPYLLDFATLTDAEEAAMLAVAREAAARLAAPWLSVDVGQTTDGRWVIIESGDPQFSGLGLMSARKTIEALAAAVARE